MRQVRSTRTTVHRSARRRGRSSPGVPAAVAGSIALRSLHAPLPAQAAAADAAAAERDAAAPSARRPSALRTLGAVEPLRRVAAGVAPAAASLPDGPATYTVQRGDTVSAHRRALRAAHRRRARAQRTRLVVDHLPGPGAPARRHAAARARAGAPRRAAPVAASGAYTVQRGDTISAIAKRHGVSTSSGAVGERARLVVDHLPRPDARDPRRRGARGTAPAPAPAPAPAAAPARRPAARYTVEGRRHDQLDRVAPRRHRSNAVLSANGLGWSSIIYPGQTLAIPASAAPSRFPGSTRRAGRATRSSSCRSVASSACRTAASRSRSAPRCRSPALRNLDWGDRDSLGLFQQRPSYGWGTAAEVRDPRAGREGVLRRSVATRTARAPAGCSTSPAGRAMTFTQAAQAVQISAYPDAYAQWEAAGPRVARGARLTPEPSHYELARVRRSASSQARVRRLSA